MELGGAVVGLDGDMSASQPEELEVVCADLSASGPPMLRSMLWRAPRKRAVSILHCRSKKCITPSASCELAVNAFAFVVAAVPVQSFAVRESQPARASLPATMSCARHRGAWQLPAMTNARSC